MYTVTVAGQYYADEKKIKKYEYTVILPQMKNALSVIKGKIEARKMPQLYEDFIGVRTRSIVDVKSDIGLPAAPDTEKISEMTLDQLQDFVLQHELPIDTNKYTDIVELRKDITDAVANLQMYLKKKEVKVAKAADEEELIKLNPELAKDPDTISAGDADPLGEDKGKPIDRGPQPGDGDGEDDEPVDPLAGLK